MTWLCSLPLSTHVHRPSGPAGDTHDARHSVTLPTPFNTQLSALVFLLPSGLFCPGRTSSVPLGIAQFALGPQLCKMCCVCVCLAAKSCPTLSQPHGLWPDMLLCPWNFLGKKYWSGVPLPTPGDLSDPGVKPDWQVDSLPLSHQGSPKCIICSSQFPTNNGKLRRL